MAKTAFQASGKMDMGKGMAVTCEARGMSFALDEPAELGGTDTGMNPVEALLSALAACKCIVVKAFAKAKGIQLKNISITCEGVLDPAGFMGTDPAAKVGFSEIKTTYHLEADNTEEEIEAFLNFVDKNCPVQDTIANTPALSHERK